MTWKDDWPEMGVDKDGNGVGEPVLTYRKPDVGTTSPVLTPPDSDEFNTPELGLQWQWQANPRLTFGFPSRRLGFYRLNCLPKPDGFVNLWTIPNLLLQKFPAEESLATAKLTFHARVDGEEVGLVVMGEDYQFISLRQESGRLVARVVGCHQASEGRPEQELSRREFSGDTIYLRIKVARGAVCAFSFSGDGRTFTELANRFQAKPGRWIGAKVGFFALRDGVTNDAGTADIDWFHVDPLE